MDDTTRSFALALAAEGKKPFTIRTYTYAVRELQRTQNITDWSSVTKTHIRAHIASVLEVNSPATASTQYRALQQFFKFLEAEEDVKNPMTGLKPPKVPEKLVPVIPADEWSKLLAACEGKRFHDIRDRAIIHFLRSTGARRAEVTGLRITDIDLDQLLAVVTGKGSKVRIIRFDAATGLAISRYLRARKDHPHASSEMLWIGNRGALTPVGLNKLLDRLEETSGLHMNPHRFRHDFSHRYLLNGGQETDLMQQNGWTSAQMLRRYGASAASERARKHYDQVMSGKK